jgi:Tfp pilus assembly protein PilN
MIKINLLNSVTERQSGTVVAVDRKISSAGSRFALTSVVIAVLLAAVVGWDIISSQMAKTEAERQLAEQKTIAAELEVVMNEQKELEGKIAGIDARIEAIKKLRASQAGPQAVLDSMRERIAMFPGLYLDSIEQGKDGILVAGSSPDEAQVTQFGRSLEFSNGLFSNLSIETTRNEITNEMPRRQSLVRRPSVRKYRSSTSRSARRTRLKRPRVLTTEVRPPPLSQARPLPQHRPRQHRKSHKTDSADKRI